MKANFNALLARVLVHEGGFVDHPKDPGGATNKGVTIATFRAYVKANGTVDDLRNITDAEVAKVYREQYWDRVRGDDLPSGLDYAIFDYAVNSGPSRAATTLQDILGVAPDAQIGPLTVAAALQANNRATIEAVCAKRMAFLKRLSTWPTFGKGWSARVTAVLRESQALAVVGPAAAPAPKTVAPSKSLFDIIVAILSAIFKR